MAAVAKNPKFAKKVGVPRSVGEEFLTADKGRKFKEGGEMKESKAMVKKEIGFLKKAGAPKSVVKHEETEMKGMKKGGKAKAYAMGGKVSAKETMGPRSMGKVTAGGIKPRGEHAVQKSGHTRGKQVAMRKGGKC